ncbi:MAG: hypothetical protein EXS49_01745 [Candidatus Pacebacteria bacterium]|nr:hypothetical protein [Candidatus Paceibacterota bacterium]
MSLLKKIEFLFLGLFLLASFSLKTQAQVSQYGLIKGNVLDEKGRMIKKLTENYSAKVFAFNEAGIYEGSLEDDGSYLIKNIPNGEWFIGMDLKENSGYLKSKIGNYVRISLGSEISQDIFLKTADGIISGKVTDSSGNSPEMAIDLIDANTGDVYSKVSDKGGFFRFFTNSGNKILNVFSNPSFNNSSTNSSLNLKKSQLLDIGLILPVNSDEKTISGLVTPEGVATIYAYSESGLRITPKKTSKSGNYSISLKKGIWHIKAVRNSELVSLESDDIVISVSSSDISQDLVLKNSFQGLKEKSINFYSSNSVSLALDDGMSIFIPERSLPEGTYNLKISSSRVVSFFGFDSGSNIYNVEILSERIGKKISSLPKGAVLKIPLTPIKNKLSSSNLELFYWNPNILVWQSAKDSLSVKKGESLISLTNYLAGFCVGCQQSGGGGGGAGGGAGGGVESGSSGSSASGGAVTVTQVGNRPVVYLDIARSLNGSDGSPQVSITLVDRLNRIGVSTFDSNLNQFIILKAPVYTVERCSSPVHSSACIFKTFISSTPLSSVVNYLDKENLSNSSSYYYWFSSADAGGSSSTTTSPIAITTPEALLSIVSSNVNLINNAVFLDFTTSKPSRSVITYEDRVVATDSNFKTVTSYNLSDILKGSNLKESQLYSVEIKITGEDGNESVKQLVGFRWPKLLNNNSSSVLNEVSDQVSNPVVKSSFQFISILKLTDTGEAVSKLQEVLVGAGYLSATSSRGYFGKKTEDALKAFQVAKGLSPVGRAGPLTRAMLNALLNK